MSYLIPTLALVAVVAAVIGKRLGKPALVIPAYLVLWLMIFAAIFGIATIAYLGMKTMSEG